MSVHSKLSGFHQKFAINDTNFKQAAILFDLAIRKTSLIFGIGNESKQYDKQSTSGLYNFLKSLKADRKRIFKQRQNSLHNHEKDKNSNGF